MVFKLIVLLAALVLVSGVFSQKNGCPKSCRCQDSESVFFVTCEGLTTGDMLKEIASTIPKNTTGLGIEHLDYRTFLTEEFPVLPQLRILCIQSGSLREVPRLMGQYFPGLQTLYISKTEIKTLTPDLFLGLHNLTTIDLNSNYIENIKSGAFVAVKNLTTLILHSNRIRKISPRAFNGLKMLSTINLKGNNLKYVKPGTFNITGSPTSLATFSEINLKGNRIKKLPDGLFAGVRAIKTLNLQSNFIGKIEEKVFHGVEMIFDLNLKKNFLNTFPTDALTWCKGGKPSKERASTVVRRHYTNIVSLNLLENPVNCNCSLIHLFTTIRRTNLYANFEVTCKSPRRFYNQPFITKYFPMMFQSCLVPKSMRG